MAYGYIVIPLNVKPIRSTLDRGDNMGYWTVSGHSDVKSSIHSNI